jgi:SAM-dependent methyltransferase
MKPMTNAKAQRGRRPAHAFGGIPAMTRSSGFGCWLAAAAVALCAACMSAPSEQIPSEPGFLGQPGNDAPYIPTSQALVNKMLEMAKVTADDYVIDLGSGDGRVVIAAAKRGARALGVEYNGRLVELSRRNAEQEGVGGRTDFVRQDLFETDLSRATVVTMYLLTEMNLKLRPKILSLAPGTRIVSNNFGMGEWIADEMGKVDERDGCDTASCAAILWIVPAKVGGPHETPRGELSLKQTFQMLSGTLRKEGTSVPVQGRVHGREVFLTVGGRQLHGRMEGTRLVLD